MANDDDQRDILSRCKNEILLLRGHIARLEPKAEAYDALVTLIRLFPQPSRGYSEDMVWKIDQVLKAMEKSDGGLDIKTKHEDIRS